MGHKKKKGRVKIIRLKKQQYNDDSLAVTLDRVKECEKQEWWRKYMADPTLGKWQVQKCHHWRQPVAVGECILTCSAYLDAPTVIFKDDIDCGLYLDTMWIEALGYIASSGIKIEEHNTYPYVVVDWKDGQGTYLDLLVYATDTVVDWLRKGKKVDIGCLGAHGRTGTLLACLLIKIEGVNARTAVKEAKSRYCEDIIDTPHQLQLVYQYESYWKEIKDDKNLCSD